MKTNIFKRMMACLLCVVMLSTGVQVASAAPGECTCTTKCFDNTINMKCSFCSHGQWRDCFGFLDIPEYTGDGTIDAASGSMQSAELMTTLIGALDQFDKITVILPGNAGEDAFNAIRAALNWATKPGGSVDLTILGATAIPTRAFESCDALGAFSAPQAESLGEFAFLVCSNLRTIHLPQVSSIGQYAFQNCDEIRTLTLGNVTSVNHGNYGIFHGVSSVNQIDLRLGHYQKELTKNGNYWQPTGNTFDTTGNSFVGYTFRSISSHCNAGLAYTANGSTITATCDCGYRGTATLSAPEGVVYDGTEKKIATVEYSDGWQSGELAVTYTNHINVGTATAKMTAGDVTASTTFKINPASISDATVTLDPENGTYTGSAYTPNVTVTFHGATLVKDRDYTLSWNKSDLTNADTYTATVTGAGNFTDTKTAIFSIAPMELDETNTVVTLNRNSFVYDGTEHKPTVEVTFNGVMLTEGVDYRVFYSRPMKMVSGKIAKWFSDHITSLDCVNAHDDYYAVVIGLGNFRTKDAFTLYANFVIEKATVNEPTITSKPYNGSAQTADVSETDLYVIEQNNGGENVGNYDVVLKLKDSENYKWATTDNAEVTLKFVISAAQNSWTTDPSISGWTYGEAAKTPVGTAKYGAVKVVYTGREGDGTAYNSETAPTKAGNYTATFTVEGTADYSGLSEQVNFTIHKAPLTITAEDKTATYGDAVPTYTVKYEGFVNGDDKDELGGALAFYQTYNRFDDVGEYEIMPHGLTSDNYVIFYNFGKLTVSPKAITVTIENASSPYGDTLAELKATDNGIVNGDANVYSLATTATGTSNVGKYAITGTALDSNYDVTFVNGEYEITRREITITVDAKNTVVNTTLPTYTYKVEGLVGVDTLVTEPTLTCNANIALIGEYDITAIGADAGGNYSIQYVPAKLTVLTDNAVDAAAGYTEELKDYAPATVTSEDKAELDEMLSEINTLLADETTTDNGKKALKEIKEQVEKLIKEITDAAEATDTENVGKVENVTPENVTPENKTDLENAKADLEKALEENSGNYTENEKKAIEEEIKRIDDALEVIGNVEAVEESIVKLPAVNTVKPDDEEAIKAITDAQTAYNALSDYEKSLVDEAAKANLDKLAAALVAYDIVEGDGSSWTEDSDHNITFVVNGLFSKFVGIKVDGKDVDKANYEAKAGSTILTLKASYLDTLAVGEHTITVVYTDGSTGGTFNVHAKANSPATGDNGNMFLWIALLFISGAVITLTVADRKRRMASNR